MQLLPHLQLQGRLGAGYRRRAFLLSAPARVPDQKQSHVEVIQAGTIRTEYDSYSAPNQQKQTTYTVTIALDDLTYTAQSKLMQKTRPSSIATDCTTAA